MGVIACTHRFLSMDACFIFQLISQPFNLINQKNRIIHQVIAIYIQIRMFIKVYRAFSLSKGLLKSTYSPLRSRNNFGYLFTTQSADSRYLPSLQAKLKETLEKNGPESQQFHDFLNQIESNLQQCLAEHRVQDAVGIYKLKASIVEQFFGKVSKKYINELRNLAYFYQTSEYYQEAIETLQNIKDNMGNTEESQSRWSELNINYNQGVCYSELGKYEQARNHFLIAFQMLQQINEVSYHRTISEGSLYAEMGIVFYRLGDVEQGIAKLQEAIQIFHKENKQCIHSVDEETVVKPFIYLAEFQLENGDKAVVEGLVLEGMSYFKSDLINNSKASLCLKAAHILLKAGKFWQANRLYNEIAAKVPLILQPNIIIQKISANSKQNDPDYQLCEKEAEKLGEIFKNLKKVTEMKKHI